MEFCYLIQGPACDIEEVVQEIPPERDIYCLTFDEPYLGNIPERNIKFFYLPNSTWSEGRNYLLEESVKGNYSYYIFLDSDARIISGSYSQFEELLSEYKPILGIPLSDQIERSWRYDEKKKVQKQNSFDQLVQAYNCKAITDGICLPFNGALDEESWWYSCEINQYLTISTYRDEVLQFNEIKVLNSTHTTVGNEQAGSIYKGGLDKRGLKKCKILITKKYGKQPQLSGTLFHPWYIPKPIYGPTFSFIINQDIKLVKKVRALIKYLASKVINLAARLNDSMLN